MAVGGTLVVLPVGGADNGKPPFPEVELPGFLRGEGAIQGLADKLPAVAEWYGKNPGELMSLFRRDRTLWVSPTGRLVYFCELEEPLHATAEAAAGPEPMAAAPFPLDQTFRLHSSPTSTRVIYLDFNGHTSSGTAWNASNGGAEIVSAPFSLDGDPTTFSTTELEMIQNIWRRVAEDYSPFDVDVTTEEPAPDAITRSSSTDTRYGTRVVISPTNDFCPNAGGVAYVGVFDSVGDYYKPAFVFNNMLANGEKYIAEACSHESGHNLGLSHDGTTSGTAYYAGHGTWAPIMGNSYYKDVSQWSKGEYTGANNQEDDLAVMQSNGLAHYPDDHGNTVDTATVLSGTVSVSGSGFIERSTDIDVFKFIAGSGGISIAVNPAPRGPNLDIKTALRDSAWNVVASADTASLAETLAATVTAGTYYLVIDGAGTGDPTTGYSDYASLGQYTFAGTIPDAGGLRPPVAVASASPTSGNAALTVNFSGGASTDTPPGWITSFSWDFGDGSAPSGDPSPAHVYAVAGSYNATLTVTDNDGMTATATVTITVRNDIYVSSLTIAPQSTTSAAWATATVAVRDWTGKPIPGATVTGTWSGLVQGSGSGPTGSLGSVVLTSPQSSSSGTITFTVTGVSAPGYTYNAAKNSQSTASTPVSLAKDPFAAPSNLKASGAKSAISLSWTDNSSTEEGFEIEKRQRGQNTFAFLTKVEANVTSYTDTGLAKNSSYEYRVRGVSSTASTAYSNTASARAR